MTTDSHKNLIKEVKVDHKNPVNVSTHSSVTATLDLEVGMEKKIKSSKPLLARTKTKLGKD